MNNKGADAMHDETCEETVLEPRLRFPEFRAGALRNVRLGDVTEECVSRNGDKHSISSVMGVTKADGIVPMDARLIPADISRYKIVQSGCFAYNPMRINIGSIARWEGKREILVSPDYVVFKCCTKGESGIEPAYLDQIRRTRAWEEFVTGSGDGSVRVRIYYKDIVRFPLSLPSLQEQQKIAACLSSLDNLIALEYQRLEKLHTHRSVLMQQILPRSGEFVPNLRFPEFRKRESWRNKTLSQIAEIRSGSTPSRAEPAFFSGGTIPWVKTTDLNNGFITRSEECITPAARARVNPAGSVLVAMYGGFKQIGRTGYLTMPAATNQAISVLNADEKEVLPIYLLTWMNARVGDWKRIASSSRKDPNITGTDVANFPISYPDKDEQQRIADAVASLNNGIDAQRNRIASLKLHRIGLIQQLIPASHEVSE